VLAAVIAVIGVAVGGIAGGAAWAVAAGLIPALALLGAARNHNYAAATLAAVSTLVVMAGVLVVVVAG